MFRIVSIKSDQKLACVSVGIRRCAGAAQISVSEGEVGHFGGA